MLIDEAHHMNVDEHDGRTLSYQLVERLQERGKVQSLVLFTGTPHRGKDTGFLFLLKLLRPQDFDPEQPLEEQVEKLRTVMIRNNKQSVTDMSGEPIVHPGAIKAGNLRLLAARGAILRAAHAVYRDRQSLRGRSWLSGSAHGDVDPDHDAEVGVEFRGGGTAGSCSAARPGSGMRKPDWSNPREDLARLARVAGTEDDPANQDEVSRLEERVAESLRGVDLNPDEIPALEELLAKQQTM